MLKNLLLLGRLVLFFVCFYGWWSTSWVAAKVPSKDFKAPVLLNFVEAEYPPEELKKGTQSKVLLLMIVDNFGVVQSAKIVKSGGKAFDDAAQKAVMQFQYKPAFYQGKSVPVSIQYMYYFFPKKAKTSKKTSSKNEWPIIDPKTGKRQDNTSNNPADEWPIVDPKSKKEFRLVEKKVIPPKKAKKEPPVFQKKIVLSEGFAGIEGYILEKGTRDPIEGASVFLLGRKNKVRLITDAKGYFSTQKLRIGKYNLVVPVANFEKYKAAVWVQKKTNPRRLPANVYVVSWKQSKQIVLYLKRVGSGLFTSETRVQKQKKEINQTTLGLEEIQIAPGTQGDPLKIVQNLPGVARTPLSTGFFIVRGSAPEDSKVYLDGHVIPALYHFGGLTSVVNGDMAKKLDFLPGNFSVAYGRGMGGIIHLFTREGKKQFHGYVDLDLIDVGFFLEGPLGKDGSFVLSARRSHLDAVLGLALPKTPAFDLTVAPRYYDFQAKANLKVGKHHTLGIMLYGSDDLLSFVRQSPVGNSSIRGDFRYYTNFYRGNFTWEYKPNSSLEHLLTFHYGTALTETGFGDAIRANIFSHVFSFRDELRWNPMSTLQFRVGTDTRLTLYELDFLIPNLTAPRAGDTSTGSTSLTDFVSFKQNLTSVEPSLYMEADWYLFNELRLMLGVRFDYYSLNRDYSIDPRFNVTYSPFKDFMLKAGVGLFSQPPTLQELSDSLGNPDLKTISAIHYTVGASYNWTPFLSTEVNFYYKDFHNLIIRSNRTVERNGKQVAEVYANDGVGQAYGMEWMIRHKPYKDFFGWISYTLGKAERKYSLTDKEWRYFNYDQTHILTVVAAYKPIPALTLSLRFRLVSGNPVTPRTGSIYDADTQRYFAISGELYSERNPLFHQLDLRVDYAFVFNRWKLLLYLDVQNVYNQPNQEGVTYNYDSTQKAPLTGIPIFPSLGIKGEF